MGFLERFFSAGPALNRLAKTFDECFNALRRYAITNSSDELFLAIGYLFMVFKDRVKNGTGILIVLQSISPIIWNSEE